MKHLSGDEDAQVPLLAWLSELWITNPQNPEDMLDWPADYVNQMMAYQSIKRQIQKELSKNQV